MKLREIAHSRTGDKGNISNISVIAYKQQDYETIKQKVTAEKVKEYFSGIVKGDVVIYELPEPVGAEHSHVSGSGRRRDEVPVPGHPR